ncbi:MAG TPA: glycosyltransferase family 4 protein [Steroidobacteraceae bacterium]|nr:glycosyltransferase family 4 protein [Steroidobacteraceae bacterium]
MELLFAESSTTGWGTEQHFAALAIAMARRAHVVRCMMTTGSPLEPLLREAGVPVVLSRYPARGSMDPHAMGLLRRLVSQKRPNWLITNDPKLYWPLIFVGRWGGARTALFRHWEYMCKGALSRRFIPRLADRFILVSRSQREHLRASGVDVSRMGILYNPIDTHRLSPSSEARARLRASLGLSEGQVAVGYVGRMVQEKGIFTLLKASERLLSEAPEALMVWVGDGLDLPELQARLEHSAYRARHLFRRWTDDMQGVYNALDVIAVPSEYAEPFGRVSVEAQACGTAVVCSDAGGLPETLSPQVSGLLTRKGDAEQLTSAVLELVRDSDRRRGMALAGRQFACANFSFERIAHDFEALLADYTPRVPAAEGAR